MCVCVPICMSMCVSENRENNRNICQCSSRVGTGASVQISVCVCACLYVCNDGYTTTKKYHSTCSKVTGTQAGVKIARVSCNMKFTARDCFTAKTQPDIRSNQSMLMKDYFKHFYIMHFFSQNVYFTDSLVLHALKDILAKVKDKIFIISISVCLWNAHVV